ncbi:MAG: hypothetical protein J5590_05775 [Clostridia bacterium]|nr:hypothetical protein [Clostridia bacterium]
MHYSGRKYFLKLPYKIIQTDIVFKDEVMELYQGSGFIKVKNKEKTTIKYSDIQNVDVKRSLSLPSIITTLLVFILFIMTQNLEAVLGVVLVVATILFLGSNGVTRIYYGGLLSYYILTDFKSEGLEAKKAIDMAMAQYEGEPIDGE